MFFLVRHQQVGKRKEAAKPGNQAPVSDFFLWSACKLKFSLAPVRVEDLYRVLEATLYVNLKAPIHVEHAWQVAKRFLKQYICLCLPETCFFSLFSYSNDE
jgi:hypothetical protein